MNAAAGILLLMLEMQLFMLEVQPQAPEINVEKLVFEYDRTEEKMKLTVRATVPEGWKCLRVITFAEYGFQESSALPDMLHIGEFESGVEQWWEFDCPKVSDEASATGTRFEYPLQKNIYFVFSALNGDKAIRHRIERRLND